MGVPVPKGTSAPVGPASHSLVVQAPTTPCQARRPASPALLAITAPRTLLTTADTRVLLVSTAPEVGAWNTAPQGTDCQQEAAHSTVLFLPKYLVGRAPSGARRHSLFPNSCFSGTKHATQFPCPRGYYNPDPLTQSLDSCLPCPPGHYCGQENLTKPSGACDAGMFPTWA